MTLARDNTACSNIYAYVRRYLLISLYNLISEARPLHVTFQNKHCKDIVTDKSEIQKSLVKWSKNELDNP